MVHLLLSRQLPCPTALLTPAKKGRTQSCSEEAGRGVGIAGSRMSYTWSRGNPRVRKRCEMLQAMWDAPSSVRCSKWCEMLQAWHEQTWGDSWARVEDSWEGELNSCESKLTQNNSDTNSNAPVTLTPKCPLWNVFLLSGLHHFFPIHNIIRALQHSPVLLKTLTLVSTFRSSSRVGPGVRLSCGGSPGSAEGDFPEIRTEREEDLVFRPSVFTTFLFVCQRQHL